MSLIRDTWVLTGSNMVFVTPKAPHDDFLYILDLLKRFATCLGIFFVFKLLNQL